jgi:hypothetical protein
MQVLTNAWNVPVLQSDRAKKVGANLKVTIQNNKMLFLLLDLIEEHRDLSLEEWNPRNIIQSHLENLLEQERV